MISKTFVQDAYDLKQIAEVKGEVEMQVGMTGDSVNLILKVRGEWLNLPLDPEMAFKAGNALIMASQTQKRLKLIEANA